MEEKLSAREYQIDLFEKTLTGNRIVYLPTGSGKTYIAVMLIKHMSGDVRSPWISGGKRTVFIVNTVALVSQQSAYIARQTDLTCGGYSGDMDVDSWSPKMWTDEFIKNQVLVMTAQIFLNLLQHGMLPLHQVNLLIVDECHHATKNHPMHEVMKKFESCEKSRQPKVLGLTATLLNSNIKPAEIPNVIRDLEITMHASIITVNSIEQVKQYGRPTESFWRYSPPVASSITNDLVSLIEYSKHVLKVTQFQKITDVINRSSSVFLPRSKDERLKNLLEDISFHIKTQGLYFGNFSILYYLKKIEELKRLTDDSQSLTILDFIKTQMTVMRRLIDYTMDRPTELENIMTHSTNKLLKLFQFLYEFSIKPSKTKFCSIIFVQRRFTAKVMYKILQKLHEYDPRFKFLSPDYVLGNSADSYKTPSESICLNEWNRKALKRFRDGEVNCIVATDVLDEGVDIPLCNLIICYDQPQDYRAYMQSKGRGRYKDSEFVTFVENNDDIFPQRYAMFQKIESVLKTSLIGKTDERSEPTEAELEENLYVYNIKPYSVVINNEVVATLTETSVVNTLEHYCATLGQSKFCRKSPVYKLLYGRQNKFGSMEDETEKFKVSVRLPIDSPLREEIVGDEMSSTNLAKQSAAMKACIRLHLLGELTDRLLPKDSKEIIEDITELLTYWKDENDDNKKVVGTKGKKRFYKYVNPSCLYDCFPLTNHHNYMHLIKLQMLPLPNNQVFCTMINNDRNFALVTNKPMKPIPGFPIFMTYGPVNVTVDTNYARCPLTREQLECLRKFHWIIFKDILELVRNFMILQNTESDPINLADNLLVAPLTPEGEIDWAVINNWDKIELSPIELDAQNSPDIQELDLVIPRYRSTEKAYIVLKVRDDMTPRSLFANNKFESYVDFYLEKYGVVIENPDQSLLEVRTISKDINFIKPRLYSMNTEQNCKKYQRIIHLIPELCAKVSFSSIYWLKARALPSILHRIRYLCIADDFREQVAREAGIGTEKSKLSYDDSQFFDLLRSNPQSSEEEDIVNKMDDLMPLESYDDLEPKLPQKSSIDLDRNIDSVSVMDIHDFQDFTRRISSNADSLRKFAHLPEFASRTEVPTPTLRVLQAKDVRISAPNASEVLCALTPKFTNDAFNFERLETLGDSFLKFFSSIYLFEKFPRKLEGSLTIYKGSMVSNRYLFYCGANKKIPEYINAVDFVPTINFGIPACAAPSEVLNYIQQTHKTPDVLYETNIPPAEQFRGIISNETRSEILKKIDSYAVGERDDLAFMFHGQMVPDKTVADCVEALTGLYLLKSGLVGAANLLKWFGVLPADANIQKVLSGSPMSARIGEGEVDFHMPWLSFIEERVGYKFKDRSFLLQAFTHSSYSVNTATVSYDRLEFLGDAIIDILITSYIYENCGDLSPGDLTDLRSALVNNITFACLTVKYGFHTALLAYAPILADSIERFIKYQQERNYKVDDDLLWILMEENECNMAEYVDVPKVLGDLFESMIGAIFLDSGKNFARTWQVLYGLMHDEIERFSKKVPKQPVRKIYETSGVKPHFLASQIVELGKCIMVPLEIEINGKRRIFNGFGGTKKQAKAAAAKLALRTIMKKNVDL
ncbi:endoribonuclease Dicer [Microplitis mediator]|uniref:endoribonuclease Dicer n=1 Tax=Microplitis mediator TaxID=375433 RepID=UPI00255512AD|nr:endoribonuclease Dicer [Microplitis mediator]